MCANEREAGEHAGAEDEFKYLGSTVYREVTKRVQAGGAGGGKCDRRTP